MSISLQNRLTLTYALFISAALAALALVINLCTGIIFTGLVKGNITKKSGEIVRLIGEQYNPLRGTFDTRAVEAIGMLFVHDGYIVKIENAEGGVIWDARSCDMEQCGQVINSIAARMEDGFGLAGTLQKRRYPLRYFNREVGTLTVETYGPFFFSETEARFLESINRLLLAAGMVLILLSIGISAPLSRAIARPILKAAHAARRIAAAHSGGTGAEAPVIRIDDNYKTTELAALSRSINELAAELEEGERRQKQLTNDIAHELRTPIACLQGDIEAMIDGVYRADREHLESCHGEIMRLAKLVQDLHTLTSLEWENISLNKTEFDLAKLLQLTAEQFRAAAREKGIAIQLELAESPISADYDRLKQVLVNLLSNAVKYTNAGAITISISIEETAQGIFPGGKNAETNKHPSVKYVNVRIADTGAGIAPADLPHIFERFYRADKSRSRGTGGSGIGLTISAAIVRAHGGSITARSENGRGSVFQITLPPG